VRDGYRSYPQAYASYPLNKIFNVNPLDLAKVGKSFGFAALPRVHANIRGGTGGAGRTDYKRRCEESKTEDGEGVEEVWEEIGAANKETGGEDADAVKEEVDVHYAS
jgi:hypothetical protein